MIAPHFLMHSIDPASSRYRRDIAEQTGKVTLTMMEVGTLPVSVAESVFSRVVSESRTLVHYTTEAGYNAILDSKELIPSIGLKNARYGSGQYLTDIIPGTATAGQTSARLFRVSWYKSKLTHFIEIDVKGLNVIKNKPYNYLIPGENSLNISKRIVSHDPTKF